VPNRAITKIQSKWDESKRDEQASKRAQYAKILNAIPRYKHTQTASKGSRTVREAKTAFTFRTQQVTADAFSFESPPQTASLEQQGLMDEAQIEKNIDPLLAK